MDQHTDARACREDVRGTSESQGTMDTREIIKGKLCECFDGKIVRKDLTKKIKKGANVPV